MLPKVREGSRQPELCSVLVASQLLQKTPKWGKSPLGQLTGLSPPYPNLISSTTTFLRKAQKGKACSWWRKSAALNILFQPKEPLRWKLVIWWVLCVGADPGRNAKGWDLMASISLRVEICRVTRGHKTVLNGWFSTASESGLGSQFEAGCSVGGRQCDVTGAHLI